MKAFFLAAGYGTRLRPFTETDAKPAIPFLGLPQILYPYFFSREMGITNMVYNTHHNPKSVDTALKTFDIVAESYFEKTILNSAGGLSHARESLQQESDFLVLNADSLFIYDSLEPFQKAIKEHINEKRLATLFTISKDGCGADFPGLATDKNNNLISAGYVEDTKKQDTDPNLSLSQFHHFIGCYIFSNRIFNFISDKPDNLIYDILLKLPQTERQNVKIENLIDVSWYELGTIKDYKTNHLLLSKYLDDNIENSFTRTHAYFRSTHPNHYPYKNSFEQQILRSL